MKTFKDIKVNQYIIMEDKDKDLLRKDLSARLFYKVKIQIPELFTSKLVIETLTSIDGDCINDSGCPIEYVKPYLRSFSSMTEEEKKELLKIVVKNKKVLKYFQVLSDGSIDNTDAVIQFGDSEVHWINFDGINTSSYIDWCNAHYFDYRGLIKRKLALEAPKGMYV